MAPKGKADYAFLLHDLYHIKPDGIMTIVLPHGVLFRGDALGGADGKGEGEGRIRRNLIENNNIKAIIGLPANIFYGTQIPTIIMVLRQKLREDESTDILFVDASKGFTKVGKQNKLMASDIKRIVDTVTGKLTIPKYSRLVTKKEIRENGYNLNIPRYIDSSEVAESWDIYATMFGGIPNAEIELLKDYWLAFPKLREVLFSNDGTPYSALAVDDVKEAIENSDDVKAFIAAFDAAFSDFDSFLDEELIGKMMELSVSQEEDVITSDIFARVAEIPLMDKYQAYQILDDRWTGIAGDLEMIQTEGFTATKQVDPNMVIKKKDGKEEEVQDGWMGHIIPFELVQLSLLRKEYDAVKAKEARATEIDTEISEIIDSIPEDDKGNFLNDDNTAFVAKEFAAKLKEIYSDIDSPELSGLAGYVMLLDERAGKAAKLTYISEHAEVDWTAVDGSAPYAKGKVNDRMKELRSAYEFPEDSLEAKLISAEKLLDEQKAVKKEAKEMAAALHLLTKKTIEELSDEQAIDLLRLKWIEPLYAAIGYIPYEVVAGLVKSVDILFKKYAVSFNDISKTISDTEKALATMLSELTGNAHDMQGLSDFRKLLSGSEDSVLEKMFPQNGAKVPQVRFAGFDGEWGFRKFGEVFEEYSEKNHDELPALTIIQGFGTVRRDESGRSIQYDESGLKGYKLVREGDFIVHLRSFEGGLEKANSTGIVSPAYHMFHGEGTDTRFFYAYFRSKQFVDVQLKPHVYGIRDGRSIDIAGMKTILIPYPSLPEQQKIGDFLEKIDDLISSSQTELEKLKNIKAALLEKMFV